MNATAIQNSPAQLSVIGRYTVSDEARVLVGRRIEGKVFVYDYPRDGQNRRYFVESGFESKAELGVLLADYRRQAERLGTCPMSHASLPYPPSDLAKAIDILSRLGAWRRALS